MRCRDDIQLLEGAILLPCPCPGLEASAEKAGFKEVRFEAPAEYEVDAIFDSPKIYKKK